jgi:hypothetical protein
LNELDDLRVVGETTVGWCAATPTNEFVDAEGKPCFIPGPFGDADPRAPARRVHDDPEVCELRERLRRRNGLGGVEILEPHEVERAARIFFRDGFVVVRDLLDPERLESFREASARRLKQILEIPGFGGRKYVTESGRLPHRYSYGTSSASRQLLHDPVWASMIDLPTTAPILERIFGGDDFKVIGAGGDLCLPGAIEYQALHSDFQPYWKLTQARIDAAIRLGVKVRTLPDSDEMEHQSRQLIFERTPPQVTINFLMTDLTWENGPIRQIPGTQTRAQKPPTLAEEPEWMLRSTLVGAPAGAGVFRDNRAWHGATPNLSREIRAMPNVEYGAPWFDASAYAGTMPHEIWEGLAPRARRLALAIKTDPGVWPAGAGVMHPLRGKRQAAKAAVAEDQRAPGTER